MCKAEVLVSLSSLYSKLKQMQNLKELLQMAEPEKEHKGQSCTLISLVVHQLEQDTGFCPRASKLTNFL